jgi:hypothetical protein
MLLGTFLILEHVHFATSLAPILIRDIFPDFKTLPPPPPQYPVWRISFPQRNFLIYFVDKSVNQILFPGIVSTLLSDI